MGIVFDLYTQIAFRECNPRASITSQWRPSILAGNRQKCVASQWFPAIRSFENCNMGPL